MFHSIQGEGTLIGVPMLFVRTNLCNLRCKWCDSTYTFTGGYEADLNTIVEKVKESPEEWVCLTGGEPLLQRDAREFIVRVGELGKKVLIETSGSLPIEDYVTLKNTLIDMDVKTPSSGEESSVRLENLRHLRPDDYIKFVVQGEADYDYATKFLVSHKEFISCGVVFQPAWGTDIKWLTEKALKDALKVRVLPQLHKLIWGEIPGV